MKHLLTLNDYSTEQIESILQTAADLKTRFKNGVREPMLERQVLALLFSKPSLRTRVSFEAGISHLGGSSLYLGNDVGFGKREDPADFARVLSQYVDFVVCRTHDHAEVETLAKYADCSVINGLTDLYHPCQALADILTLSEFRTNLRDCKLTYVGDGNNVARSLAIICKRLGIAFTIACPESYQLDSEFVASMGDNFHQTEDLEDAVKGASAIYTDVWSSMGYESEKQDRLRDFSDYQVNEKLISHAPKDVLFMHCLPAHRGEEVSAGIMDGEQSVVIQQAANRMHAQKGLLVWLSQEQGKG